MTCRCTSRSWIQMGICMDCMNPVAGQPESEGWWDLDRAFSGDQAEPYYVGALAIMVCPPHDSRTRHSASGQIGD